MSDIADNLAAVRQRIARAAARAGREASSIELLAVSKTKPAASIEEAYANGQRAFGENYAQELVEKHASLAHLGDIVWHFIGQLQTNKAKLVAPFASMAHGVDSERLAIELGKRAVGRNDRLRVLVEVNVGGESSKGGVEAADLPRLLDRIEKIPSLHLAGLMSIPPPSEVLEGSRVHHRRLRTLRDAHGGVERLPTLSMGMTDDLEVAIEEGATIVRVGTAIFGGRTFGGREKPQPPSG